MSLESLAHTVAELGVSQAPAEVQPSDVDGEKVSDLPAQAFGVDTPEHGGKGSMENEVVVQNENGVEKLGSGGLYVGFSKSTDNGVSGDTDISGASVPNGAKNGDEDDGHPGVQKPSDSGEMYYDSVVVEADETELGQMGEDDFYEGAEECDKDDAHPAGQEPSYSGELFDSVAVVTNETEIGQTGVYDFNRDSMMEMDAELGYPDNLHSMMEMEAELGYPDNVDYMEEHGYSVGDLVWGKIRSHPWWPGQIYDPSDASSNAMTYNQKGRHLVAYFGDRSFSWCLPSQLIPFAEHFAEMSRQSSSKTFVCAVQQAVDEIGRLVELEMTCSCVPNEFRQGLTRLFAVNAGVKYGVLVPEGDIGKLLSFRYDPSEVLATVSGIAESVSFSSTLELSILKGWLSAFYRARGGYRLPLYDEPVFVMGLESADQGNVGEGNDYSVPIEVPPQGPPEEAWLSPVVVGPGNGSQGRKKYDRRKQKSATDNTKGTDVVLKRVKRHTSRKSASIHTSINCKENSENTFQASLTGSRLGRLEGDDPFESDSGVVSGVPFLDRSLSSELTKADTPGGEINSNEGAKSSEDISSPRERRKSKYLSPPYTIPGSRSGYPRYELKTEPEKATKFPRVGERIKMAAEQLLDSSPLTVCVGKGAKKASGKKPSVVQADKSADLSPHSGRKYQQRIIKAVDAIESENEILSGLLSVATSPLGSWDSEMLKLTREFIYAFKSSINLNGANYKVYHKIPLNLKNENLDNTLNQTAESGARKRKEKPSASRSTADKSYTPKRKVAKIPGKGSDSIELEKHASLTSLLTLTVAPGVTLPSKDEIIRTLSKYGHIKEGEIALFPNSCCVKIVHTNIAGAEAALRELLHEKPLGSAAVDYKLCYSSGAPVAVASDAASGGIPQVGSQSNLKLL